MKKVKIMLTAAIVMAVVGGALAFKAKSYSQSFCTANTAGWCDGFLTNMQETTDPQGFVYYAILTNNVNNCWFAECNNLKTLENE